MEIRFWLPQKVVTGVIDLEASRSGGGRIPPHLVEASAWEAIDTSARSPTLAESQPVSQRCPIALRFIDRSEAAGAEQPIEIRLETLEVWRSLEYRLRKRDRRSIYPIRLADDEVFLVGDNVPVSIDSRNHGPIRRDQIMGRIQPRE
jgi:hypothetical protein